MRAPYAVLLVVITLLLADGTVVALDPAVSTMTATSIQTLPRQRTGVETEKRFLRNSGTADITDDEERANVSKFAELVSKITPYSQTVANRLWLEAHTSPKVVFKLLNLKQLKTSGTKLDKSSELLDWLRYTMSYRERMGNSKWYPDDEIYLRLLKLAPEAELATFFQALRRIPDLKVVSENLQTAQYKMWYKLKMKPSDVAARLGITELLESGKVMSDPRYIVYFGYTEVWLGKIKLN